jgi:hypothetical protein
MDVCNRYPVEVQKRYGDELPTGIIDSLRRITNVRPALATPLSDGVRARILWVESTSMGLRRSTVECALIRFFLSFVIPRPQQSPAVSRASQAENPCLNGIDAG